MLPTIPPRLYVQTLSRHLHEYGTICLAAWDSPHFWIIVSIGVVVILVGVGAICIVGEA